MHKMDAACIPRNGNDHHVPQDYCLSARSWCSVLLLKQRSEWKLHRSAPHGTFAFFLFLIQVCRLSVYTLKYKTCKKNHNATLGTLGVLYSLLALEGQGAHPRASGIRKQVWVCSADAGSATPGRPQGKSVKTLYISKIKEEVIWKKWAGT